MSNDSISERANHPPQDRQESAEDDEAIFGDHNIPEGQRSTPAGALVAGSPADVARDATPGSAVPGDVRADKEGSCYLPDETRPSDYYDNLLQPSRATNTRNGETPRSDTARIYATQAVPIEVARQLERELAEARTARTFWREKHDTIARLSTPGATNKHNYIGHHDAWDLYCKVWHECFPREVQVGISPAALALFADRLAFSSTSNHSELADKLEALAGKVTEGPWAWDQRGEKINEWGLGVAFDHTDKPLSGRFTDEDAQYVAEVCGTEGATVNYSDPDLICELRNNLPEIIAALRGTRSARAKGQSD